MTEQVEVTVKCVLCGRVFPCHVFAKESEEEQARGVARQGTLRVARYCPHCGKTVMVQLTIPANPGQPATVPVPLGCDGQLDSVVPREGEVPHRG